MLAEYLTNSLYKDGIIANDEKEIIRFGLESMEGNLLSIILTLVIGAFFRCFNDAVLLWLLLFPLRKNAGGFHANTKFRCCIVSSIQLSLAFLLFSFLFHTSLCYGICVMVAGCIVWYLAPLDNPSKKLDTIEYKVYRIRCRLVLVTEMLFFILSLVYGWKIGIRSTSMAFFIASLSLLLGVKRAKDT